MKNTYYHTSLLRYVVCALLLLCVSACYANVCEVDSLLKTADIVLSAEKQIVKRGINNEIILLVGSFLWVLLFNHFSSKSIIRRNVHEKKQLKAENIHLQQINELQQIKYENERKIARIKQAQLSREIKNQKKLLLQNITEHINLAKEIQRHKPEAMPQWLNSYLNKYTYSSPKQWNAFVREFDGAFPQLRTYITEQYPMLTESDVQYLMLAILGLDTNDIAFVLNKTTRTIWNRRDTIKSRMDKDDLSIEDWLEVILKGYAKKYNSLWDIADGED
jgi:hypothetical protein